MSKRLNPHRRLLGKQAALIRDAKLAQSATQGADMAKLQQGAVRSPLNPRVQLTAYASERPISWEGRGKQGKVVAGKFKFKRPGTKARFA